MEIGEEGWKEYQKQRDREKSQKYYKRNISHTSRWRLKIKRQLVEYKGGKCESCGYNKDVPRAHAFHHRNPEEKDFQISAYSGGLEALKKEVDKCDLLCQNCHAEVHDAEYRDDRKVFEKPVIPIQARQCVGCACMFQPKKRSQTYCCQQCRVKVKNKPTKTELGKLIEELSWVAIGKRYGVSDNAVRKWARKFGLL